MDRVGVERVGSEEEHHTGYPCPEPARTAVFLGEGLGNGKGMGWG